MTGPGTESAQSQHEAQFADMLDAMRRLILAAERFRGLAARYVGLNMSEILILSRIGSPAPVTPTELADELGRNTSTITAVIDRLEDQDLVVRRPLPGDRRKTAVYVTDRGQQTLDWLRSFSRDAFDHLDQDALTGMTATFNDTATAIDRQASRLPT